MLKVVLPLVALLSLLGGAAAGHFLKPEPIETGAEAEGDAPVEAAPEDGPEAVASFRDGFVVPILRDGQVWSHVVLHLGVFSKRTDQEVILSREPLLRDGFTEALFLHGSLGGFEGDFTNPASHTRLRRRLDEAVERMLDDPTAKVLIVSMTRQAG